MHTSRPIIQIAILLTLITGLSRGQSSRPLTLQEAIGIGMENSKMLRSSRSKVALAEAKLGETNASRLPSLKFGGSYTRLSSVPPFMVTLPFQLPGIPSSFTLSPSILDNYNFKVTLQQPLFTGFRLANSARIASHSVEAARQDVSKDRTELVFNITNAYWNLFKASEIQKVIGENVEQVRAHLKDVQNMFAQGMVTKNELLKVQVQLSEALLRQIDAKNGVQLASIALNNAIGLPLETGITTVTNIDHQPREYGSLQTLVGKAVQNRPDLKGMEYRVKAGEESVKLAQGGWWPQLFLTGNVYYAKPNQRILPTMNEFKDTWDVSLSLSFDIWNWGTTAHQTTQAREQLAQAEDALGLMKDGVALEVTQNYLNMTQARERISVAKLGAEQAEENYRVTNEKFKSGLTLNSELLDAEVALLQARTNYTQAIVDVEIAEARLEKALGSQP